MRAANLTDYFYFEVV